MTKRLKNFIISLPGPQSYCKCKTLCSPLEVEHVIPSSLLKRQLTKSVFKRAKKDYHNLYTCCSAMNLQKGSMLFGKDFVFDNLKSYHTGPLARACLHMTDTYRLNVDPITYTTWKVLDENHYPHDFEYERNELIIERGGDPQLYLDKLDKY